MEPLKPEAPTQEGIQPVGIWAHVTAPDVSRDELAKLVQDFFQQRYAHECKQTFWREMCRQWLHMALQVPQVNKIFLGGEEALSDQALAQSQLQVEKLRPTSNGVILNLKSLWLYTSC